MLLQNVQQNDKIQYMSTTKFCVKSWIGEALWNILRYSIIALRLHRFLNGSQWKTNPRLFYIINFVAVDDLDQLKRAKISAPMVVNSFTEDVRPQYRYGLMYPTYRVPSKNCLIKYLTYFIWLDPYKITDFFKSVFMTNASCFTFYNWHH